MDRSQARNGHSEEDELHDRGLAFDVRTLIERRHALKLLGGAAALALVGCGESAKNGGGNATTTPTQAARSTGSTTSAANSAAATVTAIPAEASTPASACNAPVPEETAGPFPGDGSNGPNALLQSGIVRSDLRTSFGTSNTVATGVPLTTKLTIVDTAKNCEPITGAAVYIWHCDSQGRYSMYSNGVTQENYLRGVQETDARGVVTFQTIFPGCYAGRWPHIHFEVYPNLATATSSAKRLVTSQLALPEDVCKAVYGSVPEYRQSVTNLSQVSLKSDMVFADGWALQVPAVTGDVSSGYVASLVVGV
jgi:protocatechuate 3,4-dioxygenase beta subunit